jgi:hypothetical protein
MAAMTQKSLTVAVMAGAVVLVVLGYFLYDLMRPACAGISEEVTTSLRADVDLIGKKGEFLLGKQKVQDFSDESKRYIANLKTCCIVLQGGTLGPDKFLECKNDVAQRETRVTQIVSVINQAQAAQSTGQTEVVKQKLEVADRLISEVRGSGAVFEQNVAQLSPTSPDAAPLSTAESEPNNDAFHANRIALGATVKGEIAPADDQDWFVLRADTTVRDWMDIKITNRSTTLQPCLSLYDSNKTHVGDQCGGNASANVEMAQVVEPGKDYYVLVSSYAGRTTGAYTLSVTARKAYDAYEPNNDIFLANSIAVGKTIDANIMEGSEQDWYIVKSYQGKQLAVRLENRSTTLQPCLALYDSNRTHLADQCAGNASANVDMARVVEPGKDYYVLVSSYAGRTAGNYRLTVDQSTP